MMANELYKIVADKWIGIINEEYEEIKKGFELSCKKEMTAFDEDVFQSTILNCYTAITKNGMTDLTRQGMKNYLFKSFKMNIKREALYMRNAKRDDNVDETEMREILDMRDDTDSTKEKVDNQLFNDWTVIKVLGILEDEFDTISFNCFRLKWLVPGMTYSKLKELTKVKDCKKRCIDVMKWCRENLDMDVFRAIYERNVQ